MSYTATDWKTGDLIAAEKLNNMENGIAGAYNLFVLTPVMSGTTAHLPMKMGEIKALTESGKIICLCLNHSTDSGVQHNFFLPEEVNINQDGSGDLRFMNDAMIFEASGSDEYPTMTQ